MFKVIIIGGERQGDYNWFEHKCISLLKNQAKNGIMIISTGDKFVDQFAKKFGIDLEYVYCDWKKYGNKALIYRNEQLLNKTNNLIYFETSYKDDKVIYDMAIKNGMNCRKIKGNDDIVIYSE